MSRRNGGGMMHRDAKQITKNKNRFARLDPDISSRYEDLDDEPSVPSRVTNQPGISRGVGRGGITARLGFMERRPALVANTGVKNAELVHRIKVPFGAKKFDSKWLIKQLNQKIENFKPILFTANNRGDYEFYIRDDDIASAIRANSRRIYHRDTASRVDFQVHKMPAPWMTLKKVELDVINSVVDSRYNSGSRMLDLSNFASDKEFTTRDMLMTLTKGNVMLAVIDRIDERYGNITALSLANNRLRYLDYACALVSIAKFIKVLEMSHNMIETETELEKFGGLPIENLYFEGNPICEQMSSASAYLSFVQKTFPRCAMLDGIAVTPLLVGPEIEIEEALPFRPGFYANPQIRELVEQFVVSFYQLYDGEDGQRTRKQLVEAYDENNSTFTLTIANLAGSKNQRYPNDECYDAYIRQSHNLLHQDRFARNRSSRVVKGSMDIAVAISKLPITKHLTPTFVVDVFLVSNELLGFTVQGLFEDGTLANPGDIPTPNFFTRTFTVAPREGGRVAVISDQLFVSSASTDRLTRYKKLLEVAEKNGVAVEVASPVSQVSIGINGMGFDGEPPREMKEQMVAAFCQFSGMIVSWSEKCLADFQWNYDMACQKFPEIKGIVPPEAFSR